MARRANQYFLFVFLFFMIGSTVLGLLLTNVMGLPSDWSNIIMQFLVFIPMLVIYVKTEKASVKECFSIKPLNWKNALLCLGIAYCSLPFISMIVVLTSPLQPNLVEQAMGELNDSSLFSLLFVIAVQPAVFEELLFRGALMFAMLHMNLQQALYAFLLGVIFAFMVQRTGSIFASMLPHFLINALNCVATTAQTPQQGVVEELSFAQELVSVGLQCLIFLPFLALLIYLFLRRNPAPAPALPAPSGLLWQSLFSWVFCQTFIGTKKRENVKTFSLFFYAAAKSLSRTPSPRRNTEQSSPTSRALMHSTVLP